MTFYIHSRRTPSGIRYRAWDIEGKLYKSGEMSQVPMRRWLIAAGVDIDEADVALRRALVSGTNEEGKTRNMDAEWEGSAEAAPKADAPASTPA